MTAESLGVVFVRQYCDDEEESISVLRPSLMEEDVVQFPEIVTIKDLDPKRAWYLYEEVAPLCINTESCPKPSTSRPKGSLS